MLQESFEKSEIRNSRTTATGWQSIARMLERTVNSSLVLTPNNLRLISNSDRAPISMFNIPYSPTDIIDNIQDKYETWYQLMGRAKWHFNKENLRLGDIVYVKLTESKLSANWVLGKVEQVNIGSDGCVRQAVIAYKHTDSDDPSDWTNRVVERPVRNIVKLLHIEDTFLMDDIKAVHEMSKEILKKQNISYEEPIQNPKDTIDIASHNPQEISVYIDPLHR